MDSAVAIGIATLLVGPGLIWHIIEDRRERERKDRRLRKFRKELRDIRQQVSNHKCGDSEQ